MPLKKLHEMIHEALSETEIDGEFPSKLIISDRYKEQLINERDQYFIHEDRTIPLRYMGVLVEFANLADNIHFYITYAQKEVD